MIVGQQFGPPMNHGWLPHESARVHTSKVVLSLTPKPWCHLGERQVLDHGRVEHCVARRPTGAFPPCSWTLRTASRGQLPADVPTPPREQKDTRPGHTDRFSNLQTKRWTPKRKDVARGSCLLRPVSSQHMGITGPINWKCEHSQLEMGQTSISRRERTHGSSRTLSDVNEKYWEVESSTTVVTCHNETPRHVQHNNDQDFATAYIRFTSSAIHNKWRRQTLPTRCPFSQPLMRLASLPLKTSATWR